MTVKDHSIDAIDNVFLQMNRWLDPEQFSRFLFAMWTESRRGNVNFSRFIIRFCVLLLIGGKLVLPLDFQLQLCLSELLLRTDDL